MTTDFIDDALQKAGDRDAEIAGDRYFRVPMKDWGKDHWSTFAYIETRIVDRDGTVELNRLQANANRHPLYVGTTPFGTILDGSEYGIRLAGGVELPGPDYDEWDCIDDMKAEGLLRDVGFTMTPQFEMTERGVGIASQLRAFKGRGGQFRDFSYHLGLRVDEASA